MSHFKKHSNIAITCGLTNNKSKDSNMTSYRFAIKQCPNCSCEFSIMIVASCNTLGAKFYTDGFISGSMYDEGCAVVVCPKCDKYLWTEDVPTTKTMSDSQFLKESGFDKWPHGDKIRGYQFKEVIDKSLWRTQSQEKYIRIREWRSYNNNFRNNISEEFELTKNQITNLKRLLHILSAADEYELILKAEINRELGNFNKCIKQLNTEIDSGYTSTIEFIKNLAENQKKRVAMIE